MPAFSELLRRRWWLIVGVAALALAATGVYAWGQQRIYEATASLYIRPARPKASQATPALITSQLGLLSYGSLVNTFVSIAQSKSRLVDAASTLEPQPHRLGSYSVVATLRPKSFVLDLSVRGPDRALVVPLVNRLSQSVASATSTQFPIVAVTSLDAASTSALIQPRFKRDLVYGGLAGLILGFVAAALAVSKTGTVTLERQDEQHAVERQGGRGPASDEDALVPEPEVRPAESELPAAPTRYR